MEGNLDQEVTRWAIDTFRPEDEALAHARETAETRGLPPIEASAFDARHLEILVRLMHAKKAVEIGAGGGYLGIAIARGLGAAGKLHTFELDPYHAEIAKRSIESARLMAESIVHAGPALENLPLIAKEAPFDLVFLDADRPNYPKYLAWATDHLRVGGAIIANGTYMGSKIHMRYGLPKDLERAVLGVREFNRTVADSTRFRSTLFPTAEGLTVAVKVV